MEIPYSYIALDGLICTGKTNLARLLAKEFNVKPILEEYENNPFLEHFYQDPKQNALPTQLFFLISRYQQISSLSQTDLFDNLRISDYIFEKNRIFASVTLNDHELNLYYKINDLLIESVPTPDLIVFLQADLNFLLERIKKRDFKYEGSISEDYLKLLNEAYNQYIFHVTDTPVLVLNVTNLDFSVNSRDLNWIISELKKPVHGIKYINPENTG
ncbi:MAG: deoxynucleoside kinase [bacterium]|nr:deoxynucleoside kinase [bacterium]